MQVKGLRLYPIGNEKPSKGFLQHFKLSFCCFLASTLSDKKPAVILIIVFLCVIYLFLWLLLRFCFFIFVYQQLHYVSRCNFLCIYDAGGSLISVDLQIAGCCIFLPNLEDFWPVFLQIFFYAPFSLFFCDYTYTYTRLLTPQYRSFQALFIFFFKSFCFCASVWVISIESQ